MNQARRLPAVLLLLTAVGCGGGGPTTPSPVGPPRAAPGTQTLTRDALTLAVNNLDPDFPQATLGHMVECFFTVYPVMSARFNPQARRTVTLVLDPARSGVAAASNGTIFVATAWMKSHPDDIDVVTHEAFHIVQSYPSGQPGWVVEGLADYARDRYGVRNALGGWSLPGYAPNQRYTDSYRVTARFFKWLEARVDPTILERLDTEMRAGPYRDAFWAERTGKGIDQLWADYAASPALALLPAARPSHAMR